MRVLINAFLKYLEHLGYFYGVPKGLTKILNDLFLIAIEDKKTGKNYLIVNKAVKEQIAKKNDVSLTRVNHAITTYVKIGYLQREKIGAYTFNVELFGYYRQREMLIKSKELKVCYGYGKRSVQIVL